MAFAYESVALATIRQNVFATLANLINTNKPSGWTIVSAFPEDEPTFPCIVINPAKIKPVIATLDSNGFIVEDIDVEIEFYALSSQNKAKIDEGRDNVQATLLNNHFDDSNVDTLITGREKLNTAACIIRMGMK